MSVVADYLIKSKLSERQIEADVARYFGWCSPNGRPPFRLLDVNEQLTGADKKTYDCATAIYLQFKKSTGLKSTAIAALSTRANRSELDYIREFRERRGLGQDPTLFFQLREKAVRAANFQHNVLLEYEREPWSRAVYVAPLVLDMKSYDNLLFSSVSRTLSSPFYYRRALPIHSQYTAHHYLEFAPFLRGHISIPPHEKVDTHKHYYAYSEAGCDISWHSPDLVDAGPSRLSDFMGARFSAAISNPQAMLPIDVLSTRLSSIGGEFGFDGASPRIAESPIEQMGVLGRWLRERYEIRQFILFGNSRQIEQLRSEL